MYITKAGSDLWIPCCVLRMNLSYLVINIAFNYHCSCYFHICLSHAFFQVYWLIANMQWQRIWYSNTTLKMYLWTFCSPFSTIIFRGVTLHLVTIRFILRYTASDILNDTKFAIHISDIFSYGNYQLVKTKETGFMVRLVTVCSVICFQK